MTKNTERWGGKTTKGQITFAELAENIFGNESTEYEAFVEKFKPKRTTDDCFTPPPVYDAVATWVEKEYGVNRERFVRPFYPGGDYENYPYLEGDIVVDNPPFSILSKIVAFYDRESRKYFLFAPGLTMLGSARRACAICTDARITYENGAVVNTSFVTNLDRARIRSAPDLHEAIKRANAETRAERKEMPKYVYPREVITAAAVNKLSKYGVKFEVMPEECEFVRTLDAQRSTDKSVFGSGYIIGANAARRRAAAERAAAERAAAERAAAERAAAERAAAERAAATEWQLSERERKIVKRLK